MEIVEREMAGKLLLATEALRKGWSCIVGTKKAVFDAASELPQGAILLKSIIPSEIDTMRRLKEGGHILVCLDEEGLIQTDLNRMTRLRFSEETVRETDLILCWGRIQEKVLRQAFPAYAERFQATGSPRADLWSPRFHDFYETQRAEIRARFHPYIFIPSSFGWPNHHMGPQAALEILKQDRMVRNEKDLIYFQGYQAYTTQVFKAFLYGLPEMSRTFADHAIVIRPHPSERHETWQEAARGLSNVHVVYEGTVAPWLLEAQAVLHCGSTTGVEAHLMGRPVISWDPAPEDLSKQYALTLPRSVSVNVHTLGDLLHALRQATSSHNESPRDLPLETQTGHDALREWIEGLEDANARSKIMDILDTQLSLPVAPDRPQGMSCSRPSQMSLRHLLWRSLETLAALEPFRAHLPERVRKGLAARAYGRQKTKDIDPRVLIKGLDRLVKLNDVQPPVLSSLGKNLFHLKARA